MWTRENKPLFIRKGDILLSHVRSRARFKRNIPCPLFMSIVDSIEDDYCLSEYIKADTPRKFHACFHRKWENEDNITTDEVKDFVKFVTKKYNNLFGKNFGYWETYDACAFGNDLWIQVIFLTQTCDNVYDMESLWWDIIYASPNLPPELESVYTNDGVEESKHESREYIPPLWSRRISFEIDAPVDWPLLFQHKNRDLFNTPDVRTSLVGVYS